MTRQWREEFLVQMAQYDLPLYLSRALLRQAATLQRLAEAQCNGDWPADNGERETKECQCGSYWHPSVLKGKDALCPDCRAQNRVKTLMAAHPDIKVEFQGDPRGCVVKLQMPDGREVGVPA